MKVKRTDTEPMMDALGIDIKKLVHTVDIPRKAEVSSINDQNKGVHLTTTIVKE